MRGVRKFGKQTRNRMDRGGNDPSRERVARNGAARAQMMSHLARAAPMPVWFPSPDLFCSSPVLWLWFPEVIFLEATAVPIVGHRQRNDSRSLKRKDFGNRASSRSAVAGLCNVRQLLQPRAVPGKNDQKLHISIRKTRTSMTLVPVKPVRSRSPAESRKG